MSLLAVAAVAASVLFTKNRQPRPTDQEVQVDRVEGAVSLDAIRQAGF